jgi:hypothetical protein
MLNMATLEDLMKYQIVLLLQVTQTRLQVTQTRHLDVQKKKKTVI